eukprot:scaffold45517_cov43-Attheya_sp.AAC.1
MQEALIKIFHLGIPEDSNHDGSIDTWECINYVIRFESSMRNINPFTLTVDVCVELQGLGQ